MHVNDRGLIGQEVAGYYVEDIIGKGGMAVVYLALDPRLSRRVALKILNPVLSVDDRFRQRFILESRTVASIEHPNIIPIYEANADADGVLYIAMRYVDGLDLRRFIYDRGPLPLDQGTRIFAQVAAALDAAHTHDLIHRDVKPANILLAGDHVYLTDFGITKHRTSISGLTQTDQFIGTPRYMSPEQINKEHIDGRADQYALACVVYEGLSGRLPFQRDNDIALLWAHLAEQPVPLTQLRPELPPEVDGVMMRALAKVPDQRYPSCAAFIEALHGAITGTPPARPGSLSGSGPHYGTGPAYGPGPYGSGAPYGSEPPVGAGSGPHSGPGPGPASGPGVGSASAPGVGPPSGPGAGPGSLGAGPGSGPHYGPGVGSGPHYGPASGPGAGPGSGPHYSPGAGSGPQYGTGSVQGLPYGVGADSGPHSGPRPGVQYGHGPGSGPPTGPSTRLRRRPGRLPIVAATITAAIAALALVVMIVVMQRGESWVRFENTAAAPVTFEHPAAWTARTHADLFALASPRAAEFESMFVSGASADWSQVNPVITNDPESAVGVYVQVSDTLAVDASRDQMKATLEGLLPGEVEVTAPVPDRAGNSDATRYDGTLRDRNSGNQLGFVGYVIEHRPKPILIMYFCAQHRCDGETQVRVRQSVQVS